MWSGIAIYSWKGKSLALYMSCILHVKIPKNYALYVPKRRNVLHSTCQNTEKLIDLRTKMPQRPDLHMPKFWKIKHFTWQIAETSWILHAKMPKNYALYLPKCRKVLHSPCKNTETSHISHATTSKRPNLRSNHVFLLPYDIFKTTITLQQTARPSHYKYNSVNPLMPNDL
jgi:hypothetical protein